MATFNVLFNVSMTLEAKVDAATAGLAKQKVEEMLSASGPNEIKDKALEEIEYEFEMMDTELGSYIQIGKATKAKE